MDDDLFQMMVDIFDKLRVRKLLAETFFSEEISRIIKDISSFNLQAYDYADKIESMAAEPFVVDHSNKKIPKVRKILAQVRETGFSLAIRKNYEYRCAICRNRVVTPEGKALVEGAHIIPWSQSNNDDPRNGISLCRSHHWMFDNMMVTVEPDFKIRLSRWLIKGKNQAAEALEWNNQKIILPEDLKFIPSKEALQHQNERFELYHNMH